MSHPTAAVTALRSAYPAELPDDASATAWERSLRAVLVARAVVGGDDGRTTSSGCAASGAARHRSGLAVTAAAALVRLDDGSLVEIQSSGLRHGPAAVMERLARGEVVGRDEYFFRTLVRFTTGAAAWRHLNDTMAIAVGSREARRVLLDVYRLT